MGNYGFWISLGLFFLYSTNLSAAELTGKVIDADTRTVLRDVNVRIVKTGKTTASDKEGTFRFADLAEGSYALIASHVGYDHSDTVHVSVPATDEIVISLKSSPWVLNDVVVTGTRSPHLLKNVPVQTEVVTQADFKRTGATTVDEALEAAIGININNDLSGSGATIRGVEGDRVLVMIDGERAVGRVNGAIDLSQFALTNVEKIEVVKGTGSTLYGSDAMGGVINIITKRPSRDRKSANFYVDYGTDRTANPAAQLEYGTPAVGLTIGGKYYRTDGFDLDKSTPHTNGQDAIDRWNWDGRANLRLTDRLTFLTSGRFMYEKRNWVEAESVATLFLVYDDDETNKRYEGSAGLEYLSGDKYSMKLRLFGTNYDHQWNKVDQETGGWIDTSKTKDKFYEVSYTSNYVIGQNHVVTYGFDYNYQDLTSTELSNEKRADRAGAGYLQYEYSPHAAWNFLPGIRYENHSSFGGHVNPSMNVMYKPSDNLKLRAFVGKGFRAPSIKEQYFTFDHSAAGYIVYGGEVKLPDDLSVDSTYQFRPLTEETSLNGAVSAEFSYGAIGVHRLTLFHNHLDDMIEFTGVGFNPKYWRGIYVYQNIERAYTRGLEWESRVKMAGTIDLSLSYTFLHSRDLVKHRRLTNRPNHTVKGVLSRITKGNRWGATLWFNYESDKRWTARTNTGENEGDPELAPDRLVVNVNVFHRIGPLEAFARIENIFDRVNMTYGYWPGRMFFAGFRYDFAFEK